MRNPSATAGLLIVLVFVVGAVFAPLLQTHDPQAQNLLEMRQGPSAEHLLGTDQLGRDIFSRLLYGARISLSVGVASVLLASLVGIPLGLVSGYQGGNVERVIMRLLDILLSFPRILLAILVISVLGPGLLNMMLAIGTWTVPIIARIVRSSAINVRRSEFVTAAKALGTSDLAIMFKHVLPNCLGPLLVTASLSIATAILTESGLSFLGLGVPPGTPAWGLMMANGREVMRAAPHIIVSPGIAVALIVLAFNFVGDGLRQVTDPRSRA